MNLTLTDICSVKLTHASIILQSDCLMGLQSLVSLIFLILKHVLLWHLALGLSHPSFLCLWPILYRSVHLMSFPTIYCLRQVFLQCSLSVLSSAKAFYHTTLTFKSMQWSPFSSLLIESRREKKNSTVSAGCYPSWISIAYNFGCLNLKPCSQLWNSKSLSEWVSFN